MNLPQSKGRMQLQISMAKFKEYQSWIKIITLLWLFLFKGNLKAEVLCDSVSVTRDSSGHKKSIEKFKNGNPCGAWIYFRENGKRETVIKHNRKGQEKTFRFNDNDKIYEVITYKGKVKKRKTCNCK